MSYPLYQLPSTVEVVRLAEGVGDVYGPNIEREVPVYNSLCVRFTDYGGRFPDPDKQYEHGVTGKRLWKVLTQPALAIQPQDRVKVPWGVPPNWNTPLGVPTGFYPKFDLELPDTSVVTLVWNGERYEDSTGNYYLYYNNTNWVFVDDVSPLTHNFDASTEGYDVTAEQELWPENYTVDDRYGDYLNYRVVQYYHAYDECGQIHHSVLFVELECDSPEADESTNPIWQ